jgi:hypothetical protein
MTALEQAKCGGNEEINHLLRTTESRYAEAN